MDNDRNDQGSQNATGSAQPPAVPTLDELKAQASRAGEGARNTLASLTADARTRVDEVIQQQKAAGADQLAGFAHAAQSAASELEGQSPVAARLFKDAAGTVDRFADDLRNSDVREVLGSISDFARRQPAAFFAGTVLAGFVLARFFKSEAAPAAAATRQTSDTGYRAWSSDHAGPGRA